MYFSFVHWTIVVFMSFVVAATAAVVSGTTGVIFGGAINARFLLLLGAMNAYVLFCPIS